MDSGQDPCCRGDDWLLRFALCYPDLVVTGLPPRLSASWLLLSSKKCAAQLFSKGQNGRSRADHWWPACFTRKVSLVPLPGLKMYAWKERPRKGVEFSKVEIFHFFKHPGG